MKLSSANLRCTKNKHIKTKSSGWIKKHQNETANFIEKIRWGKKLKIRYLWSTHFIHETIYNKKVSGECETFIVHIISLSTKQEVKLIDIKLIMHVTRSMNFDLRGKLQKWFLSTNHWPEMWWRQLL